MKLDQLCVQVNISAHSVDARVRSEGFRLVSPVKSQSSVALFFPRST